MSKLDWLKHEARRSATEHGMMGQVFETYRSLENCSAVALADQLGCAVATLDMLALCRKPSGEAFAEQVELLCERFGLESSALVDVLRQVEIMGPGNHGAANDAFFPRSVAQAQIAARDRRRKDEPET